MGDDYGYNMVAESTKVSEYDREMPQSHTTDYKQSSHCFFFIFCS